MTDTQKVAIILLGTLQFALLVAAWWDIRRRPAAEINGSKVLWTLVSLINFVGPLAYFIVGRKKEIEDGIE
ncbi:MAG: PLD nuclease N-terminal domain-containing protein [Anaerolineae bacterium]